MDEREQIVAWLREQADKHPGTAYARWMNLNAEAIERGAHLQKPAAPED